MFTVNWTQHAIGHGGFHTGRASVDDSLNFNWIFDCGSRRTAKFDLFLQNWTKQNQQRIDWLFISHFDTDHVSGLDTLMSRAIVRDVMVPYVNERELALQLLYEIDQGNLNRAFFELVADPAAFFLGRGADRVTFLRGRRPGSGAPGEAPRPGESGPDRGWDQKIIPQPKRLAAPSVPQTTGRQTPGVQVVEGQCAIVATHGPAGLLLKPYRAPIVGRAHQDLVENLKALVGAITPKRARPGLGDLAFAVGHLARTEPGRKSLCKLFDRHAGSSNRSSLSLLSTPYVADETRGVSHVLAPMRQVWDRGTAGWLSTGDAELLKPSDLDDWGDAYATDLAKVRVLALPHHGSDKNSDDALQELCPEAVLATHVKANAKKHPGRDVKAFAGGRLACVTELAGTEVRMHFRTPW
jgi:hypothetical protein